MDSLLASYASSSDEEKEVKQPKQHKTSSSSASSLFSSLPPPSSTSTSLQRNRGGVKEALRPSSFSSLPPPSSSSSRPKRVVEFRPPPINQSTFQDDEEDEEADREQKRRKESQSNSSIGAPSVKSFLSTIPAPKNSFSSLGGGRRSAIDTQTPTSAAPETSKVEVHPTSNSEPEAASYAGYESGVAHDDALNTQPPTYSGSEAYGADNHSSSNYGDFDPNAASYVNYETGYDQNPGQHVDAGYGSYEGYGHQNSNSWGGGSMAAIPHSESALRILGKRSKIPAEIVEVKQDELMKNRPREDQSKMTGIAFGPSYQPVSSKGKPTKLHKRKHQIGSLFFDMKQKETELAERRSKGFLTKAETHAKYGW